MALSLSSPLSFWSSLKIKVPLGKRGSRPKIWNLWCWSLLWRKDQTNDQNRSESCITRFRTRIKKGFCVGIWFNLCLLICSIISVELISLFRFYFCSYFIKKILHPPISHHNLKIFIPFCRSDSILDLSFVMWQNLERAIAWIKFWSSIFTKVRGYAVHSNWVKIHFTMI